MRSAMLGSTIGLVLLSTAARAQNISYDYDKTTNFAAFKTYAWVRGTPLKDELNDKRIVNAVDVQLSAKGLTKVDPAANPDLLVAYHATFDQDVQINAYSNDWGAFRLSAMRSGTARVEKIVTGTLVVDLVEAQTKAMVWRGKASKEVDTKADPEKRDRNISRAAEKLFKHYPPGK